MMNFNGAARKRSPTAIAEAATTIGVEAAALAAVIQVEAAGSGFDAQGRPKMLFEPHRFYANLTGLQRTRAVAAGLAYAKWKPGAYPKDSYPRINKAMAINEEAALLSASWGLPQMMGENFRLCGYASVEDMVEAFCASEDAQITAMALFLKNRGIVTALKAKNWARVALLYNG